MNQIQTLNLFGELPDLNAELNEAKKHWSKYARTKDRWTHVVELEARKRLEPVATQHYPVKLEFVWHMKDLRKDPDNIAFAKKYVIDGLVNAGILEGDGAKQIDSFSDYFNLRRGKPGVTIAIHAWDR